MNSCNTDIFFSNYYHLLSVRFELSSLTRLRVFPMTFSIENTKKKRCDQSFVAFRQEAILHLPFSVPRDKIAFHVYFAKNH